MAVLSKEELQYRFVSSGCAWGFAQKQLQWAEDMQHSETSKNCIFQHPKPGKKL